MCLSNAFSILDKPDRIATLELLHAVIVALPSTYRLTVADLAHLVSANVSILDQTIDTSIDRRLRSFVHPFHPSPAKQRLKELWSNGLQHLIPTPAGMLVGCATVEHVANQSVPVNLGSIPYERHRRALVWNDRLIDAIETELNKRQLSRRRRDGDASV